jgi:hypothetical protein
MQLFDSLLFTIMAANIFRIEGHSYITQINGKFESMPYYDEQEKTVKYQPAFINLRTGYKKWCKNGETHSFNDQPAVVENDNQYWYKDGVLHRDGDKPAVIDGRGTLYYRNGNLNRDNDLPAIIWKDVREDGREEYYKDGIKYTPNSKDNTEKKGVDKDVTSIVVNELLKDFDLSSISEIQKNMLDKICRCAVQSYQLGYESGLKNGPQK